jgi:hypothetical protein
LVFFFIYYFLLRPNRSASNIFIKTGWSVRR